jgi:hypothetical protein
MPTFPELSAGNSFTILGCFLIENHPLTLNLLLSSVKIDGPSV